MRHVEVVGDQVALRVALVGPEDLVEVREAELAVVHLQPPRVAVLAHVQGLRELHRERVRRCPRPLPLGRHGPMVATVTVSGACDTNGRRERTEGRAWNGSSATQGAGDWHWEGRSGSSPSSSHGCPSRTPPRTSRRRVPAFRAVSGQTLGFLALLVALAGLGVSASQGSGRIWYGLIGLLGAAVMLAAGLLAIFSPSTMAQLFATTQTMSKLALTSVQNSINETVKTGFADGTLTASVGFGADPRSDRRAAGRPGRDLRVPQEAAVRRLIDRSILRVRTRAYNRVSAA